MSDINNLTKRRMLMYHTLREYRNNLTMTEARCLNIIIEFRVMHEDKVNEWYDKFFILTDDKNE